MILEVLDNYISDYPNPIELTKGDTVQLGEESDANGPYPDWVFCVCNRTGNKGWVAKSVLSMTGDIGSATENYTSKEMNVKSGDKVDSLYELNGWYWCIRIADGVTGWVAKDNIKTEK